MGGTTPILGFPYPTGSDRVMDGDNAIQALAEAVEDVLSPGTDWEPYTPALTAGTNTGAGASYSGRFARIGDTVFFEALTVMGATRVIVGGMGLTLPVPANVLDIIAPNLTARYLGNVTYTAVGLFTLDGTGVQTYVTGVSGASAVQSPTIPFTWAAGHKIAVSGTYRAA